MCLYVTKHLGLNKLIAEKDITCYKVLLLNSILFGLIKKYKTPYYSTKIKLGKSYQSEFEIDNYSGCITIEKALHSFKFIDGAKKEIDALFNFSFLGNKKKFIIVECTIPKGSEYYIGRYGDDVSYASKTLKYTKKLLN